MILICKENRDFQAHLASGSRPVCLGPKHDRDLEIYSRQQVHGSRYQMAATTAL